MTNALIVAGAAAAGAVVLTAAAASYMGRMLVAWNWPESTKILGFTDDTITLKSTPLTRYPGTYGLRTPTGHARVGGIVSDDGRAVVRTLEAEHGDIRSAVSGAFDGDIHAIPDEVGPYSDVIIETPAGPAPAWQFGPDGNDLWVLHVHGFQADRNNVLRMVEAMLPTAGAATHLVVSYRGDGQGPATPAGTTRLGLDEWEDVDAALAYAARHGATRIIMAGWSMGAAISLLIEERSAYRDLIIGNVFVSPATDWIATMRTSAERMGIPLPAAASAFIAGVLRSPLTSWLTGLRRPVDFAELDWTRPRRVHVPTLVIHSVGDLTIPISATRRFVEAGAPLVELHETRRAPHTREYNEDPEGVTLAVSTWLTRVLVA
ncbi:Secreted protein [Microbacterium esteraromaticum]|uniref:Secreted protein n=1 Tax=Microbacterium esteraromaticum TaxID=57043 RepID=A0A1R4KJ21_9MICO|nr:alpha/beta fold hydrolase [Microbacterium esteraromaticum]SJN44063.1 Secreted protein [Microbacterium esteraromaticum]